MMTTTTRRMTADEWAEVRARWEADPRDGYTWIVNEMNLQVTVAAVHKRARNEGWAKRVSLKAIVDRAHARADKKAVEKQTVSGRFNEKKGAKVDGKVDASTLEAVDLRANVLQVHRDEWEEHRASFPIKAMVGEEGFTTARIAKTTAEAIRLRQEGERRAWGLDAVASDTSGGVATLDELDAMFEQAMKRAEEMREAVRKERSQH